MEGFIPWVLSRPPNPIPARPDWRVRTRSETRYYLYYILYTGTLIDLFFLRDVPVPIGTQTISVITKIICTYTKQLPPEWCPKKSIHIYRVPFTFTNTYTCTFLIQNFRDCGSSADEHLSLIRPALLMWNVLSFSLLFCTYTD